MQIGDWGNVLIHHVHEWKHRKYSPWACPFSGVEFHGTFHFQKIIFLQLFQIWSSYCFHCDTDQLWTHSIHKATTRQSVWNRFYWQSKIWPPICAPFGTKCVPVFHWNKQSCINIVSCNTLLKLQWNKQQGHRQCHWLKCRLIFIGCCVSLYLIVQTVSECEYCVCVC